MTKRIEDNNGWHEIKDNPLSKVGVFPYMGSSIDPAGSLGLEPDKTYSVYRSQEELSEKECIDSFKLVPWIDEHEMLGKDQTPAEEVGVQGVVGEDVYFDEQEGILKGNIKFFSDALLHKVTQGKTELSCGYRCKYEINSGKFQNECYDIIQTSIRGNHLALVDEGRMGPDVSVLDSSVSFVFTIDSKDIKMKGKVEATKDEDLFSEDMDLPQVVEALKAVTQQVAELMAAKKGEDEDPEEVEDAEEEEKAEDADEEEAKDADEDKDKAGDEEEVKDKEDPKASGMDSLRKEVSSLKAQMGRVSEKGMMNHISKRNDLASKLAPYIGVFDHAVMTHAEVTKYGAKKLGLTCTKGQEGVALDGYFHNRTPDNVSHAFDSKPNSGFMDKFLKGAQ